MGKIFFARPFCLIFQVSHVNSSGDLIDLNTVVKLNGSDFFPHQYTDKGLPPSVLDEKKECNGSEHLQNPPTWNVKGGMWNICKSISQGDESVKRNDREMPDYKKKKKKMQCITFFCLFVFGGGGGNIQQNLSSICNSAMWVVERLFPNAGHLVCIVLASFHRKQHLPVSARRFSSWMHYQNVSSCDIVASFSFSEHVPYDIGLQPILPASSLLPLCRIPS